MAQAFLKCGGGAQKQWPDFLRVQPIFSLSTCDMSNVGFRPTVLAFSFCITIKFLIVRTKNRGSEARINWTCGQGNCVAKVYCFSNPTSCSKYHNRPYSFYLSATVGEGLKNRAPPSNQTSPVMPQHGKMLKMTRTATQGVSPDFPHRIFDYLSVTVLR